LSDRQFIEILEDLISGERAFCSVFENVIQKLFLGANPQTPISLSISVEDCNATKL